LNFPHMPGGNAAPRKRDAAYGAHPMVKDTLA
jgi:hypothetical protein